MRRIILAAIALSVSFSAASTLNGAQAPTIRVASSGLSAELLPLWIGQDRGVFKKHGLDTEVITIQGGPLAIQALVSGSTQFHVGGTSSPMESKIGGANTVTLAVFIDSLPYTLVSSPKIKTAAQLKGAKFAVSRLGSVSDLSLRIALRNMGINPEKEVTILGIGDQTSRFSALKSGIVDATVISPPLTVTARQLGLTMISSFQDAGIVWAYNSIDVTQDFAQNNRSVILSFLRGFVESIAYIHKNKEASIATMGRWMRMDDREALNESYDYVLKIVPKKPYATDKGMQAVLDALALRNPAAKKFTPREFYDMSYLKELDASGFLNKVYE